MGNCTHFNDNQEWLFQLTGNVIEGLNEYVCKACGMFHVCSKEEERLNTFYLPSLDIDDLLETEKRQYMKKAFEVMFKDRVEVYHRIIRRSGASAHVNLPKKFAFTPATILCWTMEKNPEVYGQMGKKKARQGAFAFHPIYSDPSYRTKGDLMKEIEKLKGVIKEYNPEHELVREGNNEQIQKTTTESTTENTEPSPSETGIANSSTGN